MENHPLRTSGKITRLDPIRASCTGDNRVRMGNEQENQKSAKNAREITLSDSIKASCTGDERVRGVFPLWKGTTGLSGDSTNLPHSHPPFQLETARRWSGSTMKRACSSGTQCTRVNRFRDSCTGVNRVSAPSEWGSDRATAAEVVRLPPRSPGFLNNTR